MFMRHQIETRGQHTISTAARSAAVTIAATALPSMAFARQIPDDIDTITTASIPSQAMLWTVDPSIILALLLVAFIGLSVAGFALARRSMRDEAIRQKERLNRSFE